MTRSLLDDDSGDDVEDISRPRTKSLGSIMVLTYAAIVGTFLLTHPAMALQIGLNTAQHRSARRVGEEAEGQLLMSEDPLSAMAVNRAA